MPGGPKNPTVPNPLADRAPELFQRLSDFRTGVNDMLLNLLAAMTLKDPTFCADRCTHAFEDVRATVLVLRVLTKDSWDRDDIRLFDACWREAVLSDLFADEFEPDRVRIQYCVEASRQQLRANGRTFW